MPGTLSRTMLPELLASHVVQEASPSLALPAGSSGLTLLPPRLGMAGYLQVNLNHHTHPDPCLPSGFGLYLYWKHLSWLTAVSLFFLGDGFLHPFSKDKTNCLFNLPRNKWARGGVGREAYLLFLWAGLPGYFQRDS